MSRRYRDTPDDQGSPEPLEALNPLPAIDRPRPGTFKRDGFETLERRPHGNVPGEMVDVDKAAAREERDRRWKEQEAEWADKYGGSSFGPYGW